ncbi:formin-binding protein [Madurella fahalii]|uniref:Formin-binding protein n=1 Tax=Madurella fahalii TaxID=1157608 RepID=A0ABQ0GDV4_9PEZI
MLAASNEGPAVALSFANNFWGKDDAGVGPLLERMHNAKQTCDELRAFYGARASIEDEYARKLMSLCRKPLGSHEIGTLKTSLDTVRGEVESMAKQHQNIAAQMKSELEEPLAAFAGGMKERRKIVQNTVEKLLKTKIQQTQLVNKTRDRYEQECLKIKGYLAQGHMVMGQEERKNKAKLEKTQISLATSNTEYEAAVKVLEETTARWNREWKAAADKFQDLEEERLDFTKSSLWTFANIASTVCVSDDASCEKIRLSLEKMEVEKDIANFIKEKGTGQEIPDAPKYINFCRGDVDSQSEVSEDENYSVAQFPRSINPAFRSSSPQPSVFESHHDPNSTLARNLGHGETGGKPQSREATVTPQKAPAMAPQQDSQRPRREAPRSYQAPRASNLEYDPTEFAPVPHDPYPMDGMTMLCRPTASDLSTAPSTSSARPSSRDSHSETSFSSQEPPQAKQEPLPPAAASDKKVLKKKSGFFQNHSPFRRRSTKEVAPNNRNTWHPSNNQSRPQLAAAKDNQVITADRSVSPDPIAANASLALNVGQNVFAVETPDRQKQAAAPGTPEDDPIALALAELKGVTTGKNPAGRISADHYHGIATPVPGTSPHSRSVPGPGSSSNSIIAAAMRGTPPPSYDHQVQRLGVPPPAVTSKAMKESSQKFQQQTRSLFSASDRPGSGGGAAGGGAGGGGAGGSYGSPMSRPGTRRGSSDVARAPSPGPQRSVSPRPGSRASPAAGGSGSYGHSHQRSASPGVYASSHRGSATQLAMTPKQQRGSDQYYRGGGGGGGASPSISDMARSVSPSPYSPRGSGMEQQHARPSSRMSGMGMDHMAMQLAQTGPAAGQQDDGYGGSMRGRHNRSNTASSMSMRGGGGGGGGANNGMSLYEGAGPVQAASRTRSKSVAAADAGRYTRDGRPILHFARALYMYQAAIPEELGFAKGDILAILRHQDDGWWEATVQGGNGLVGLVPSNYLQPC